MTIGPFNTDGNGGHALSRGVEMQAAYVPVRGLTLHANMSFTDAFFKSADPSVLVTQAGQRLFYVCPNYRGALSADYSWPIGNLEVNVGGGWSYTSNQYDTTNFLLPSYSLVNVHGGVKWENYSVNLFVKNLMDKRAIVGDTGYAPINPYTVTITQPLTVGIAFNQHF